MTAAKVSTIRAALIAAGVLAPEAPQPPPAIDLTGPGPGIKRGDPRGTRYADKAMHDECTTMATTPAGGRNDTLNRCAYKLGSLVSGGHLDRDTMITNLWNAARQAGLQDREIRQTLYSGARAGAAHPRIIPDTNPTTSHLRLLHPSPPQPAENGPDTETTDVPLPADAEPPPEQGPAYLDWFEVFANLDTEPDWLVPDLFERGGNYALYSEAKAGKSLLTLDLAAALASGRPILGGASRPPETVMYVDQENSRNDVGKRLHAMGYDPRELHHRLLYANFPNYAPLDTIQGAAQLLEEVAKHQPTMVVLDTIGRMISGPENDADTWHNLYRCTIARLKAAGVAVLRLDHMGKSADQGMRGSSAKVSDVDAVYRLAALGDRGTAIQLDRTHTRNGNGPDRIICDRLVDPLRHIPSDLTARERAIDGLIRTLDVHGIDPSWGRPRVSQALANLSPPIGAKNDRLQEAIKRRKLLVRPWEEAR